MADNPKVKPSAAGIWIGLVMMLLSIVSCVGGCVLAFSEVATAVEDTDKLSLPASQEYEFEDDAAGIIVGIAPSSGDAKAVSATLTGPDGTEVTLDGNTSFTGESTTGEGSAVEILGSFDSQPGGTYVLTAEGPPGAEVAILNISLSSIVTKAGVGVGVGALLFLIGLILAIVTGVRRGKAKRAAKVGGYGTPPGMGGMPPAPGQMPPPPGMGGMPPAPGQAPPAPGGFGAPPAPGGFPPAPAPAPPAPPAPAPPAPGGFPPPPAPAPGGFPPPPAPQQDVPAPPPPGQWGETPPQAPPFQ